MTRKTYMLVLQTFLRNLAGNKGEKWGREAIIPKNFDYRLTGLERFERKPLMSGLRLVSLEGMVHDYQNRTLNPL